MKLSSLRQKIIEAVKSAPASGYTYTDIMEALGLVNENAKSTWFIVWRSLNGESLKNPVGGLVHEGTVIREVRHNGTFYRLSPSHGK
jgi:hypothetical protein